MDVLNLNIIKSIPFPLCQIREQILIINEIETRLSVCNKIEETINNCLQKSETLRQSILKQAFEGKLVKPDENYN
jgi:type I restriction enzyme S subunit